MNDPIFLIVDLFCGFGGTTTGFEESFYNGSKVCKVIACVNHDPKAIKSHWLNHPEVKHFEEDIRTLDLKELVLIVDYWRSVYPNAFLVLWASLECTNFSKAKGGLPRDADSRTLAEHLDRYIISLNPEFIQIENVVEFMSWGPLDDNGKPLSKKNGQDWVKWRNSICEFGYYDQWKEMNSADYGAYTSRNRLFGCFAKNGLPIVWPNPTHSKKASFGLFGDLQPWKPVKDVLDFSDEGQSIFNRKKSLSEKTLERIYSGLIKYVAKGHNSYLAKYYSGKPDGKVNSIESPAGTITTTDHHSLIQTQFLLKYNSINGKTGVHNPPSIEQPSPVVTTQGRLGIVAPKFIQYYYGNGHTSSLNNPCSTLTTKDRTALVQPEYFIDRDFKSVTNSSIEDPAGTITTVPKMSLVEADRFIMPTNYDNKPKSIEEPLQTITANRKYHYLINPQFNNGGSSVENPCFTLIAKMDKRPPYLIEAENGAIAIKVFETDSPMTIKIKRFMADFGLIDIKMRMLKVSELLKIQGFPEEYQMVGNQSDQKKFIGNSVHPTIPKSWAEAFASKLFQISKQEVA